MPSPLQRLKERKLVQWALAYLAAAVVVVGVLEAVAEAWQIPTRVERSIHILLILGLLITLVLAWYHGEKGRQGVSGVELATLAGLLLVGGMALAMVGGEDGPIEPGSEVSGEDPRTRIAVLPLRNQSPDSGDAIFAGVIQEDLTLGLGRIPSLAVIPRFSVERYRQAANRPPIPEMAATLDANYFLDGSAGIIGDVVRITLQLVPGGTGVAVWSDVFEEPWDPEDYTQVLAEIVQRIASELRAAISPEDIDWLRAVPTQNRAAFEAYKRAHETYWRERLNQYAHDWELIPSIQMYEEALELDPQFSLALAGLALSGTRSFCCTAWAADSVGKLARRALAITPDLPEANLALALSLRAFGDKEGALAALRAAEEKAPGDHEIVMEVAAVRAPLGGFHETLGIYERLQRQHPSDRRIPRQLQYMYLFAHRYDDALEAADRLAALSGGPGGMLNQVRAYIHLARGEREEALAVISENARDYPFYFYGFPITADARITERLLSPEQRQAVFQASLDGGMLDDQDGRLGEVYWMNAAVHEAAMGQVEDSRAHWDSLRARIEANALAGNAWRPWALVALGDLTLAYVGLGEKEAAIRTARRLVDDVYDSACGSVNWGASSACGLLARVYTHFGEHDAAIDILEEILPAPSLLTVHILQIDPIWQPLHGHPRFQALLEEYADDVEHD